MISIITSSFSFFCRCILSILCASILPCALSICLNSFSAVSTPYCGTGIKMGCSIFWSLSKKYVPYTSCHLEIASFSWHSSAPQTTRTPLALTSSDCLNISFAIFRVLQIQHSNGVSNLLYGISSTTCLYCFMCWHTCDILSPLSFWLQNHRLHSVQRAKYCLMLNPHSAHSASAMPPKERGGLDI